MPKPLVIDIHFHLLADVDIDGCLMSTRMKSSPTGFVAASLLSATWQDILDTIDPHHGPHSSSKDLADRLVGVIDRAAEVDGAVLLAMDCIVGPDGKERREHSDLIVTNAYAQSVAVDYRKSGGHKHIRWGASIHPYRTNAIEVLDEAVENGAALVKWVPSTQQIDLADSRSVQFAEQLRNRGIPLLCHMGREGAIPVDEAWRVQEDPGKIEAILNTGATIVIAHCAAPYTEAEPNYLPTVVDLLRRYPDNLYLDTSALLLGPVRGKALSKVFPEFPVHRLVQGSDYPLPTLDLTFGTFTSSVDYIKYMRAVATSNWLDMDVLFKKALGVPDETFTNTAKLLNMA